MKKRIFLVSTSRFHYRQLANELETDDISVKTVISSSIRYCKAPPFFFAVFTPLFFNVSMLASRLFPRSRLNQFLRFAANKEATLRLKLALLLSRVKPSAVVTLSHIGYVSARNKSFLHIVDVPLAHPYHVSRVLGSAYADLGIDHSAKKIDFVNTYDIEHQSILSADLVTVPSQFVRQTLIDNGVSSGKIVIIPYGLNFSDFKSEQKVAQQNNFSQLNPPLLGHNADGSIFRILFVGGLTVRKGLHVLLEAFDRIDYYNKELVLIGPFSWETSLLLSRYGDKRIRLLGKVPHVSLPEYYNSASVFVLPSLAEGLAVVLGEALSFSLPIIASDATGVENLISDPEAYVKVASGDVESLRQAFEMLIINRSHLDFLSRRSRQHVLERSVGWEEYGNSWRNLLNFHR